MEKKNHPEIGESKQAVTQLSDRELKIKSACQTSSQGGDSRPVIIIIIIMLCDSTSGFTGEDDRLHNKFLEVGTIICRHDCESFCSLLTWFSKTTHMCNIWHIVDKNIVPRTLRSDWPWSNGAMPITSSWISFLIYGWCCKEEQRSPECRISTLQCSSVSWSVDPEKLRPEAFQPVSIVTDQQPLSRDQSTKGLLQVVLKKKKKTQKDNKNRQQLKASK